MKKTKKSILFSIILLLLLSSWAKAQKIQSYDSSYTINNTKYLAKYEFYLSDKDTIYNGNFDIRILEQTACKYQLEFPVNFEEQMFCVMEWYSEIWGDFNDYHQSYVWQKLTSACRQQNVETSELTAHDALSDCIMTQRLISTLLLNGYEL